MGKLRARNPTLAQKKMISAAGLIARNWYVVKETDKRAASGQQRDRKEP